MSTRPGPAVDQVVRLHQALADTSRLKIAQALYTADASPGELAALLGISSNLLAHHLNVLEAAGVVHRQRSEGDRRRHYVTLDPRRWVADQIAAGLTGRHHKVRRLAFVCTHNSARSQLAAAHWNAHHLTLPAVSAGTHPAAAVHPRAVALARRVGLPLDSTGTRSIGDTVAADDLVIAVCDRVHEELPEQLRRMHWSIPDPVARDTDQAFTDAYQQLADRINRLGPTLDLEGPTS